MSERDDGHVESESANSPQPSQPPDPPSGPGVSAGGDGGNGDDTARMMNATKHYPGSGGAAPTSPPVSETPVETGQVGSGLAGAYGSTPDLVPTAPATAGQLCDESTGNPVPSYFDEASTDPLALASPTQPEAVGAPVSPALPDGMADGNGAGMPPSVPNTGWSTMGETPTGPPAQVELAQGSPKYLPPVNPPGSVIAPKAASPEKVKGRWGWRALTSFVAGGLIAAAGFGAAQISGNTSTGETEANAAAVEESEAGVTPTSTAQLLPPVNVEEPAAYVADLLGPAVVQVETDFGTGSGVIYDDGLVLTNQHVVDGARSMMIRLSDGQTLPAELAGSDTNTDIAVLSIEKGLDLPIAELATGEKAVVGQIAIAIGSPFQLQQSVTAGIVSAVDRPLLIGNQRVVAMIQTDAPINPGNSGGALADKDGRVIGINTSIQTDGTTSTNAGVGFAVPIGTARSIADLLVSGAPIESGFLGVTGREPLGGEAGVEIDEVTPGSAAENAGLEVGDRVLSLDGAPVTQLAELAGLVLARQAGDTVELEVVRSGETIIVEAILDSRDG